MLEVILLQKAIMVVMVEVIILIFVMAVAAVVLAQLEQTVFKTQVPVKDLVEMVL
jgi:hypothetical protein